MKCTEDMKYVQLIKNKHFPGLFPYYTHEVSYICHLYIFEKAEYVKEIVPFSKRILINSEYESMMNMTIRRIFYLKHFLRHIIHVKSSKQINSTNFIGEDIQPRDNRQMLRHLRPNFVKEYTSLTRFYIFDIVEVQKITIAALSQQNDGIPNVVFPKNPYTNEPFSMVTLLQAYHCIGPYALHTSFSKFYSCNFNIEKYLKKNKWHIRKECAKEFFKTQTKRWVYAYLDDVLGEDLKLKYCIRCMKRPGCNTWNEFLVAYFLTSNYNLHDTVELVRIFKSSLRMVGLNFDNMSCQHSRIHRLFRRYKANYVTHCIHNLKFTQNNEIEQNYINNVFVFGINDYSLPSCAFGTVYDFFTYNEKLKHDQKTYVKPLKPLRRKKHRVKSKCQRTNIRHSNNSTDRNRLDIGTRNRQDFGTDIGMSDMNVTNAVTQNSEEQLRAEIMNAIATGIHTADLSFDDELMYAQIVNAVTSIVQSEENQEAVTLMADSYSSDESSDDNN